MNETPLPRELSDAARAFAGGPHLHLIDGERVASADGRTFATVDPSTGSAIAEVCQGGAPEVDQAVAAARGALSGEWDRRRRSAASACCSSWPAWWRSMRASSPSWRRSTTASR